MNAMSILNNYPLVAAMAAILISQITKIPAAHFLKRPVTITLMFSTGGMPSSHSAGVTALITAFIIQYGFDSPFTAIAATFGILVMFDSMGVRRQSGEHGIIINELIREIHLLTKSITVGDIDEDLQEDIENGEYSKVIIKDITQLSRNTVHNMEFLQFLEDNDCKIESMDGTDLTIYKKYMKDLIK